MSFRVPPLMIEIAIHYYVTASEAGDFGEREGRSGAPAIQEFCSRLLDAGLLRKGERRTYEATPAAGVWINALCSVPFPVQVWVIPGEAA